jgi:hypothetical protein
VSTPSSTGDPYADLAAHQRAELDRRCDPHRPANADAAVRHARWRESIKTVMAEAIRTLPPGRESALVLTALDEALMWGNAAIARPPMPSTRPAGH